MCSRGSGEVGSDVKLTVDSCSGSGSLPDGGESCVGDFVATGQASPVVPCSMLPAFLVRAC